jgi:DNA-binding cell septation regulator SpoVG
MISCIKFRPFERGSIRGFADLALDNNGLVLHGVTVMETDGRRWISLPSKLAVDKDKNPITKDSKRVFNPIVSIPDRAMLELFSNSAINAIDRFLGEGQPAEASAGSADLDAEVPF